MSTTQAPSPTIRNEGTKPKTPRKLFVNLPVEDLQRSINFFEALGFTFNRQFTDATATCMLVGEDAYFMLLTKEKFAGFVKRPIGNAHVETSMTLALSSETREGVDDLVQRALSAGAKPAAEPIDHAFMYGSSFYDLDGHHWEVFWMDPSVVPAD